MKHTSLLAACLLTCTMAACSSNDRPRAEPAPLPAAPAAAPAPVAPEALDPTPEELPLPEDFENEAEQQVTPTNFKARLAEIEKEMDAEK